MNTEFIFSELFSDFHNFNQAKKDGLYKFFNKCVYKYNLIKYLLDTIKNSDNEKMIYEYLIFCYKLDNKYTIDNVDIDNFPKHIVFILINIMLCIEDQDKLDEYSNTLENKDISTKFKKKMSIKKMIPYKRTSSL